MGQTESKRQRQVAEIVRRNFGLILFQDGGYIYGDALVTVTRVKMSPDLSIARIYLSIYNTENKDATLKLLEHHAHKLRQSLAYRVKRQMRKAPFIELYLDDTLDEMYRLNQLFDKLEADDQMPASDESE